LHTVEFVGTGTAPSLDPAYFVGTDTPRPHGDVNMARDIEGKKKKVHSEKNVYTKKAHKVMDIQSEAVTIASFSHVGERLASIGRPEQARERVPYTFTLG